MFPNLLKVEEHLTIKLSDNPSYLESNFIFLASSFVDFKIFGEHFKAAHGALVSPEQWLGTTALVYRVAGDGGSIFVG